MRIQLIEFQSEIQILEYTSEIVPRAGEQITIGGAREFVVITVEHNLLDHKSLESITLYVKELL